MEVQGAGREIHLLLTTAAQVKCQMCGAASQWLVLSPRSQQVSCSPCFWVGFLLQSKDTLRKWNWDTQIASGFECICLSVCVTPVIDWWHVHSPPWLFTSSQWKTLFRKLIDWGFCGSRGSREKAGKLCVWCHWRNCKWPSCFVGNADAGFSFVSSMKKRYLLFCYIDFDPSISPGCCTFYVSTPLVTTF